MSAFTIAFQVPNLVRSLFADAAIQAAFVPVFTEQLERGNKREAFRLASTLIFLVTLVLTVLTAAVHPHRAGADARCSCGSNVAAGPHRRRLSQILFPILVMLGTTGMVVGILNSYNRFGAFAISPFFWNVAIIAVLVAMRAAVPRRGQDLRVRDRRPGRNGDPAGDPRLGPAPHAVSAAARLRLAKPRRRRVLLLMLPVTISLGLINFNLLINSIFGSLVSEHAPAAIDKAFRIYMLPQGIFSVAVTTVLFPTLARLAARREYEDLRATMANGMRQIVLLLVPAAAAILVLSVPMVRLVYQRGEFDAGDTDWLRRRSSGSPSRCPSTGSSCCSRGPSSASSGPGCRPRSRASTWRSPPSPPWRSTRPSASAGSSPPP